MNRCIGDAADDHFNNGRLIMADLSPMMLTDVNDHCLVEIFRFMSLEDLCTVSEVCKRFQQLAITAFKSTWKNRVVKISNLHRVGKEWKQMRLDSLRILRHFGGVLTKLHVQSDNQKIYDFIVDKCGPNLVELKLDPEYYPVDELNEEKLTKFTNLRSLRLFGNQQFIDMEYIQQNFMKLEYIAIGRLAIDFENLRRFLQLNPQLKRLGLTHDDNTPLNRDVIQFIDESLPELEELQLQFSDPEEDFTERNTDTNVRQPRFFKNLKRLIIEHCAHTESWLRYISISNGKLEEIHFYVHHADGWNDFIDLICSQYKELKVLKFNFFLDDEQLMKLGKNLPKLSKIECDDLFYAKYMRSDETNERMQWVPRFIREAKQLTCIVLKPFFGEVSFKETIDLNQWTVSLSEETLKVSRAV